MDDELVLSWVEAQVQTIVSALNKKHLNPSGSATFQLVPDWGPVAERERAFALGAERLRAQVHRGAKRTIPDRHKGVTKG